MKRYPVAGQLLEHRLFFGLSVSDLEVGVIPLAAIILASGINSLFDPSFSGLLTIGSGILGLLVGLYVLWRTPAGQTPREWLIGAAKYIVGPDRYLWQPVERGIAPGRYLDNIRTLHSEDSETPDDNSDQDPGSSLSAGDQRSTSDDNSGQQIATDGGQMHSRERSQRDPSQYYHHLTREETTTQAQLAFEYVREDGIIITESDNGEPAYVGLVHITPTSWLSLDDEGRQSTINAYADVLRGISYPFQVLALPREFDLTTHFEEVERAAYEAEDPPDIMQLGRSTYIDWLNESIGTRRVKVRDFYIAVRVESSHVREQSYGHSTDVVSGSLFQRIVGCVNSVSSSIRSRIGSDTDDDVIERQCISEVRSRQHELAEALPRTGVQTEMMDDRADVLDVLYRYYNHADSPLDEYSPKAYAEVLPARRS
jgi:hypothetical protein